MSKMGELKDNLLGITWHDSAWIPILNAGNVLDYFSERSNPFYDRTCNNEIVKMQRLSPEQLNNMTGLEYILLHVQEPILYVIRKQHRHSPTQVTPISDYYIIAGIVYQAPDLSSVINSRLLNTVNHMQSAFDEMLSYSRYHPSKGYTWEFKDKDLTSKLEKKKEKKKEEPSSLFQRQRVDMLLVELARKFPLRVPQQQQQNLQDTMKTSPSPVDDENPKSEGASANKISNNTSTNEQQQQQNSVPTTNGTTIKQEKPDNMVDSPQTPNPTSGRIKPPPEKRPRIA